MLFFPEGGVVWNLPYSDVYPYRVPDKGMPTGLNGLKGTKRQQSGQMGQNFQNFEIIRNATSKAK